MEIKELKRQVQEKFNKTIEDIIDCKPENVSRQNHLRGRYEAFGEVLDIITVAEIDNELILKRKK